MGQEPMVIFGSSLGLGKGIKMPPAIRMQGPRMNDKNCQLMS